MNFCNTLAFSSPFFLGHKDVHFSSSLCIYYNTLNLMYCNALIVMPKHYKNNNSIRFWTRWPCLLHSFLSHAVVKESKYGSHCSLYINPKQNKQTNLHINNKKNCIDLPSHDILCCCKEAQHTETSCCALIKKITIVTHTYCPVQKNLSEWGMTSVELYAV